MYTHQDYLDKECTWKQYTDTLGPITLELGATYVQSKGTWHEKHYTVIFTNDDIAVCRCTYNAIGKQFAGEYDTFYVKSGFRYNDNRVSAYQLKVIK